MYYEQSYHTLTYALQEEDEWGFLVSEGGYAAFSGGGLGLDPREMAKQVRGPTL